MIFFFQAEDGIRDLVRSRGLGDVYKRQALKISAHRFTKTAKDKIEKAGGSANQTTKYAVTAVSYTHLTLPTSDLV